MEFPKAIGRWYLQFLQAGNKQINKHKLEAFAPLDELLLFIVQAHAKSHFHLSGSL